MKKKVLSSMLCLLIIISLLFSFSVPASAAVSGTITGVMQDTAIPGSGKLYWTYKYNKLSGVATLEITGNGYMPDGTDQDWFAAQQSVGCYIHEVTIGEGVKSIMSNAFLGEKELKGIKLPSTIERIGENAFAGTPIKELHIPKKVSYIDGTMFTLSAIEKFTVDSGNPYYKAYEGNIYTKDMKMLAAAAPGKFRNADYTFTFPKSVTEIGKFAFYRCGMTSFTVPYHIKSIYKGAFDGCEKLAELSLQNGVESIYDSAFLDCNALHNVHLPKSVQYLGIYALCYRRVIAYDGIAQLLDEQGISHPTITYSNYEYYAELAGYSGSMFVYPATDIGYTIYAEEGSVGETYAKRNGTGFVKASSLESVTKTYDGVMIKWTPSEDAESYRIYRQKITGGWEILESEVESSVTSYLDKTPHNNKNNVYAIRTYYNNGEDYCDLSGKSIYYVKAPQLTSIKNEVGGIRINWTVTDGLKYHYIYRKGPEDVSWVNIARVGGSVKTYVDKNVLPGTPYSYTVIAKDSTDISAYKKDGISINYVEFPKFTVSNTATGVTVKWTKLDYAEAYRVYRKTTGSWQLLEMVSGDKNSFIDKNAKSGTVYSYTIRAVYEDDYSGYVSSGTKLRALAMPTLKSAENKTNGVSVTWSKVAGAKGYYVYRKAPGAASWQRIANIKSGTKVSYLDKNVKNGNEYVYTVKAYNGDYKSAHENEGITTKFVSAPKVSSAASTKNGIKIKYNAVTGADSYRIYRKTGSGSWVVLGTVKTGTTTYLDKTAKKGQTYSYTVRAYSGSYRSGYYSNTIKVKDIY